MTYAEKIKSIIKSKKDEDEYTTVEKLVSIAYWMGRESATVRVSDVYRDKIHEMRERANACRYHNLANEIIGMANDYIYFGDYAQDVTNSFGSDEYND